MLDVWAAVVGYELFDGGADRTAITAAFVMLASIIASQVIFFVLAAVIGVPLSSRHMLKQQKGLRYPLTIEVAPPRIVITNENSNSRSPTEDFLKWAENGKVLLLYRSGRSFNTVPKRVASDAFIAALKAELARAGVPKASFKNS
ncbi:MAG TPA: YcxB family protein [Caulobacteraceae bacterium]|nr:YcxB family protein [Caulobacteraceae bacterium]